MPAATGPSVGYRDQFWLHDGTELVMLNGVTEFDFAQGGTREQVDVTDLNPPGEWRRQFISTFYEDTDYTISLNYLPLSPTDVLLTEASAAGDERPFMMVIADQGVLIGQAEGVSRIVGYAPERIAAGDVKTAVATYRVVSINTLTDYVEPVV